MTTESTTSSSSSSSRAASTSVAAVCSTNITGYKPCSQNPCRTNKDCSQSDVLFWPCQETEREVETSSE